MTRPRVPGVHVEADVTILVREIGALITAARRQVSVTANAALVTLYWQIGRRVRTDVLEGRRAEYGAQVVSAVGKQLEAIELKIGDFKPADSGQMELYLRWLDRHERQSSEQSPLGIILCAGKKRETVEYLDLDTRGIHVAEYMTELPPREVLEERLHRAIEAARNRLVLEAGVDAAIDAVPTRSSKGGRKE